MKKIVLFSALALAACGPQQPYPQQQTAQRPACDPQVSDCYGYGVGRDSHGDALVAGVVGAAAGYAAGRYQERSRQRDYDRDYDRSYRSRDYDDDRSYGRRDSYRDTYRAPAPVAVQRTAPITRSYTPAPAPKPARTMFGSARRK